MPNTLKGLLLSIILLLFFIIFYYSVGIRNWEEMGALLFLIPAFPLIGFILGYAANKTITKRFRKLLLLGLFLVYCTSTILAAFLIISEDSQMIQGLQIPYSIFMLATAGFFIFGIASLPILIMGIYILEKWTRPSE